MTDLSFLTRDAFDRVRAVGGDADATLTLLADMCRLNTLVEKTINQAEKQAERQAGTEA